MLGNTVASDLDLSPLRAVGQTIDVGGVQFKVIGVLAAQGGVGFASVDSSVLVPLGSIEGRLVAFRPSISQVRVQAEPAAVKTFQAAVESTLRTQHDLTTSEQDDFQIVNASSIASAVSSSTKTLTRLMAAIAAISLVVGGIGVANVMLVTVRERTREIGVRRAVGATRRDIVVQFLVYAVITSIIGGFLGLAVGIAGAYVGGSALERLTGVLGGHGQPGAGGGRGGGHSRRHRSRGAGRLSRTHGGAALRVTGRLPRRLRKSRLGSASFLSSVLRRRTSGLV